MTVERFISRGPDNSELNAARGLTKYNSNDNKLYLHNHTFTKSIADVNENCSEICNADGIFIFFCLNFSHCVNTVKFFIFHKPQHVFICIDLCLNRLHHSG